MSQRTKELEELRGVAPADLEKELVELEEGLFKLRYGAIAESLENTKEIRTKRKRVARIQTVLRERAAKAE